MKDKLETIQTKENLNTVCRLNEPDCTGAYTDYSILINCQNGYMKNLIIPFQKGPRKDHNSRHGVTNEDLLEIVRDRLICFQKGEFACDYNQEALFHVEAALYALNKRVEDRISRGVLGENKK